MAVLYLDADDEITSAAARIRSTDDDRIAIVLPFGSRLATSRINFRLLAREATERGKTIEVIAADASARALAMTAGLTVHPSVAAFEGGPIQAPSAEAVSGTVVVVPPTTPVPAAPEDDGATSVILVPRERREPVPVVGRVRPPVRTGVAVGIGLALLAAVAVLGLVAFAVLPSASIVVSPWSSPIGPLALSVVADPAATAPDPATLTVPARLFTLPVTVSQTFPATGVKITETKATGTVTFSNFDTGRGVVISKGAEVRTESGVSFRTVAELSLPKATFDFFPPFAVHPSTGSVGVEAVDPGPTGNVGNNTITVIPKAKNTLHVTNPEATSGGSHTESPAVSQEDVDNALATLNAALPDELDKQIGQAPDVPSGMTLYPATAQLGTGTPTVDPKTLVGKEASDFELGLSAQGTVLGVDASPVQVVAAERLKSKVQPDWALDPASIQIDVGTPTIVGSVVTFPVTASASQVRSVDGPTLLAQVKGLDLPAARARLDAYGEVQISVWPDWVTTVPNSDRATLTVGSPKPSPAP